MQQCGFCSLLSSLLRRAMCVGSRRGSSESYYRELGDQETLKIEDKSSNQSNDEVEEMDQESPQASGTSFNSELETMPLKCFCTGRFLTMHKRRKKRLLTRSLEHEPALLDDMNPGQIKCILNQSVQWKFNAFTLENVSGGRCLPVLCIHLFHMYGLIPYFKLDVAKAWKLFSLIEEGYHSTNPYHNSVHAADVTQAMHCFLQQKQIRDNIEPLEVMASLLAAIAHDMDHPGVNQSFLIATSNHLASLYHFHRQHYLRLVKSPKCPLQTEHIVGRMFAHSLKLSPQGIYIGSTVSQLNLKNTSVLENHHWRSAVSCLNESGLLDQLQDCREVVERQISSLILATDITRQQEYLNHFKCHLDTNTLDMSIKEQRHLVLQIALKCADISNPCRPWEVSRKWSLKVCEEFFRQGDYERKLNLPVTALCDRHTTSIPKIQTGFLKFVVTPLITEWHRFLQNDLSSQMLENLAYNQSKWEMLLTQEMAEETQTEISEADMVDDDLETCSGTNISGSSEFLLPMRRSSLNPHSVKHGLKDQLRRFSVPLNVFQDSKYKNRNKSRSSSIVESCDESPYMSAHSLHSQLSVRGHCGPGLVERLFSTEKLLPDSSIASITTPVQATRLSTVLKGGGTWKLIRQQTFPPLETAAKQMALTFKPLHTSNEDALYSSRSKDSSRKFSNLFRRNDTDKTDNDDASENNNVDVTQCSKTLEKENRDPFRGLRRNSSCIGSQLRENLTTVQLEIIPSEEMLRRRQSMPAEGITYIPKEKKMREVAATLFRRPIPGREWVSVRRGSAPTTGGATDHLGRKKTGAVIFHTPSPALWLAKQTFHVKESTFPRRSSLPIEASVSYILSSLRWAGVVLQNHILYNHTKSVQ